MDQLANDGPAVLGQVLGRLARASQADPNVTMYSGRTSGAVGPRWWRLLDLKILRRYLGSRRIRPMGVLGRPFPSAEIPGTTAAGGG